MIHHSAGSSGSAAQFHCYHLSKGRQGLGYHFVIGNGAKTGDGEIEVGFRWTEQIAGAHAIRNLPHWQSVATPSPQPPPNPC